MAAAPAGPSEPAAEDALRRFLAGERAAFEDFARSHQDRIFRMALGLLGRREDARDATQEVFLRAYRGLPSFRFEAQPATWLFALTLNVCREARRRGLSEQRKRSRWLRLVGPLLRAGSGEAEEPEPLRALVAALPPRQREVVVLRIYEELSVAEAAAVLGVPEGTVKSNFAKAIAALRSRLRAGGTRVAEASYR